MVMLDVNMGFGAYAMQDEERVRGLCQGTIRLAESGIQLVGRRKPTDVYRNAFNGMQ